MLLLLCKQRDVPIIFTFVPLSLKFSEESSPKNPPRAKVQNRRNLAKTSETNPFPTPRKKKTSKIKTSSKISSGTTSNESKSPRDSTQKSAEARTQRSSSIMMDIVKESFRKARHFRSFSSKSKNLPVQPVKPPKPKNLPVQPLKPLKAAEPPIEHTFGELRLPIEAHPKRTKSVLQEPENTRAEKPRRRPKFQKQSKQLKEMMERRESEKGKKPSKEEAKKEAKTVGKGGKKETSVYLQAFLNTSETAIDYSSSLQTACEEKALITEAVNKPPPKIEDFFELANPFDNECEDVSDTVFDVANDFPDLFLSTKALTRRLQTLKVSEPTRTCADVKGLQVGTKMQTRIGEVEGVPVK